MGFKVDTKNIEKPESQFDNTPLPNGIYDVAIEKCEYTTSSQGNLMLKLTYKTMDSGRFIFDQIMDDPTKQINAYRLGRLLAAIGIELKGEVELRDLPKVITKGKKLKVAIFTKEGSTFTNIDITNHDGYYPFAQKPQPELNVAEEDLDVVEIEEADEDY